MRPLNFVLIFIVCVVLVLFSLQNTELATIQVIEGVELEAPLAIELIAATGFGAVLAWLFSLLSQLQRVLNTRQNTRQIRQQEQRIQELEKDLKQIHQQKQRIQELEENVEQINTEEKTENTKPVLTLVSSPETEVKPVTEAENSTKNSTEASATEITPENVQEDSAPAADTDPEKVKTDA